MFDLPKLPPCPTLVPPSFIEGWDEFHKWACQNEPTWSGVFTAMERGLITEKTGLRYLAAEMLALSLKWRGLALDMQRCTVQPVIVIPDTWKIPEPSNGGSDQHLVRLILLSRRVVETSDEPECGCEYQHERCAAMAYRNAVRELESFIKEIEPNESNPSTP